MPRERHLRAKGRFSGTGQLGKEGPGITQRVMILAELPPKPVDSGQDSDFRPEPLNPPLAAMKLPDAKSSRVFLVEKEQADPDPDQSSSNLDPIAFDPRIVDLKRMRATRLLLVSKPGADGFSFLGWKSPPLFRGPKGPEVWFNPSVDPAELKRRLGEASQQGAIDPAEIKKLLSEAVQEGAIDPRALKKMLAQVHREEGSDAGIFEQKGLSLGRRFHQGLDQQKREMETQQGGKRQNGKPFVDIDSDF
jgi:hypothetical protein